MKIIKRPKLKRPKKGSIGKGDIEVIPSSVPTSERYFDVTVKSRDGLVGKRQPRSFQLSTTSSAVSQYRARG